MSADHNRLAGIGAIYIRRRPRVRVEPVQSGGGQERGMRSGTVPTPIVVGLGAACELAQREMEVGHLARMHHHSIPADLTDMIQILWPMWGHYKHLLC